VDRLPLAIMMGISIVFGIFPGQLLHVIRSGVDPILARIIDVAPIATQVGGSVLP
jgi:NADH-quinone oxidoreductase subunit M